MELFTTADGEFDFGSAIGQIHGERNDSEALDLGFLGELGNFGLFEQESTLSLGFVVMDIPLLVGFDIAVDEDDIAILDNSE